MDDIVAKRIVDDCDARCEPASSLKRLCEALVRADTCGHLGDYPNEEQLERKNEAEMLLIGVAGEFFRRNEIEL